MAGSGISFKFKITYPSQNGEVPIGFVFYDPNLVFFPTTFGTLSRACSLSDGDRAIYVYWYNSNQYNDTFTIFNATTNVMSSTDQFASKGVKVAPLYASDLGSP